MHKLIKLYRYWSKDDLEKSLQFAFNKYQLIDRCEDFLIELYRIFIHVILVCFTPKH